MVWGKQGGIAIMVDVLALVHTLHDHAEVGASQALAFAIETYQAPRFVLWMSEKKKRQQQTSSHDAG